MDGKERIVEKLEQQLGQEDFGKNWDGAYQDALPVIRRFLEADGFATSLISEAETESRDAELVATNASLTVRIPWEEDYNGRSLVDLRAARVEPRSPNAPGD